jgi:hypothetical protein
MSEYKKEIIKLSIAAVLLAVLLGVPCSYFFPEIIRIQPPIAFAFAWVEGDMTGDDSFSNKTISWNMLEFEFRFMNGSLIHFPYWILVGPEENITLYGEGWYESKKGEFNATTLQSITVRFCHARGVSLWYPRNSTYRLETNRTTIIDVFLEALNITDLGSYNCWNDIDALIIHNRGNHTSIECGPQIPYPRGNSSASGLWRLVWTNYGYVHTWVVNATQLSSMLHDSGTAFIAFDTTLKIDIDYEIVTEDQTTAGRRTLSWEETMGTIEIIHNHGKLFWMRYDFSSVRLVLLTTSE